MAIIYKITNKLNGKTYVGETTAKLHRRIYNHKYDAIHSKPHLPLYQDYNKYGEEIFDVQILEQCDDSIREEREKYWIEKLDTINTGYNTCFGGIGQNMYKTKDILSLWNQGYTSRQIAGIIGCNMSTVNVHLHLANISTQDLIRRNVIENDANKTHIRKIGVYAQEGVILQEFNSIKEAAIALLQTGIATSNSDTLYKSIDVVRRNIEKCLNGERDIAYGLKWTYL